MQAALCFNTAVDHRCLRCDAALVTILAVSCAPSPCLLDVSCAMLYATRQRLFAAQCRTSADTVSSASALPRRRAHSMRASICWRQSAALAACSASAGSLATFTDAALALRRALVQLSLGCGSQSPCSTSARPRLPHLLRRSLMLRSLYATPSACSASDASRLRPARPRLDLGWLASYTLTDAAIAQRRAFGLLTAAAASPSPC